MEETLRATTVSVTATINLLPVGTIMPFAGNLGDAAALIPQGWLLCDGAAIENSKFPGLAALMKKSCGGTQTQFNLPDLQGVFLRGFDGTKGRDPDAASRTAQVAGGNTGNNVLTRQDDAYRRHQHITPKGSECIGTETASGDGPKMWERFQIPRPGQPSITTADEGGNETRPINVTVNYIIFAGLPKT